MGKLLDIKRAQNSDSSNGYNRSHHARTASRPIGLIKRISSCGGEVGILSVIFSATCVGSLDSLVPSAPFSSCGLLNLDLHSSKADEGSHASIPEWRDDVGQRYSELRPPLRKVRHSAPHSMVKGELLRKLSEEKVRSLVASRKEPSKVDEAAVLLDLDKTCLFNNDGCDLGLALQWMDRPDDDVMQLYRLLVNPALRPAFHKFSSQANNVKVVIYTMRSSLLCYRSNFRGLIIQLKYAPDWHVDGQLYLPAEIASADDVMAAYRGPELIAEEFADIRHSVRRLLAARDAICETLGLNRSIPVVVTATHKVVSATAVTLGLPDGRSFLWDDNPNLAGCRGVVQVPPYLRMDRAHHDQLINFLDKVLPAKDLDEDLIEFMSSAPLGETALAVDERGELRWSLPSCSEEIGPWPVPLLSPPLGGGKVEDSGGCMSPVTPADGSVECDLGLSDGRRLLSVRMQEQLSYR